MEVGGLDTPVTSRLSNWTARFRFFSGAFGVGRGVSEALLLMVGCNGDLTGIIILHVWSVLCNQAICRATNPSVFISSGSLNEVYCLNRESTVVFSSQAISSFFRLMASLKTESIVAGCWANETAIVKLGIYDLLASSDRQIYLHRNVCVLFHNS